MSAKSLRRKWAQEKAERDQFLRSIPICTIQGRRRVYTDAEGNIIQEVWLP